MIHKQEEIQLCFIKGVSAVGITLGIFELLAEIKKMNHIFNSM